MSGYRLTPGARQDLRDIRDRIARDRPQRAVTFIAELRQVFALLGGAPLIGRKRSDLREGVRGFVHAPYLVFYRPTPPGVTILRVIHARRDLARIFGR